MYSATIAWWALGLQINCECILNMSALQAIVNLVSSALDRRSVKLYQYLHKTSTSSVHLSYS